MNKISMGVIYIYYIYLYILTRNRSIFAAIRSIGLRSRDAPQFVHNSDLLDNPKFI